MRSSESLLTLVLLLCCYFYLTSAIDKHGKEWGKEKSHWKKGGVHHTEGDHGGKNKDDDWDKWSKHGGHENYDKGGRKSEQYGKHHAGHDEHGKHNSGSRSHNSWSGHNVQGGKSGQRHFEDRGRKNKGFKNTYSKTVSGEKTTYHDISDQGNYKKDYNDRDHWNKYGGGKLQKGQDKRERFDQAEHGDKGKGYGESGRDNHDTGGYKKGGDHHHGNRGQQENAGEHYSSGDEHGGRVNSSDHGGFGYRRRHH